MTLADRIAVMNRGVIEQLDTPARVYDEPGTLFVGTFVGSVNQLPGSLLEPAASNGTVTVKVGGTALRGTFIGERSRATRHARVLACFRPHAGSIAPESGQAPRNAIIGRVMESAYLGDSTVVIVDADGMSLRVKRPGDYRVEPGTKIEVCVDPALLRVYPIDAGPTGSAADPDATSAGEPRGSEQS